MTRKRDTPDQRERDAERIAELEGQVAALLAYGSETWQSAAGPSDSHDTFVQSDLAKEGAKLVGNFRMALLLGLHE